MYRNYVDIEAQIREVFKVLLEIDWPNIGPIICNDPTIGSYNHYHLSPNGIPRGIQRWYGLVYFIQIAGKPRIRPRQLSSSFEVLY